MAEEGAHTLPPPPTCPREQAETCSTNFGCLVAKLFMTAAAGTLAGAGQNPASQLQGRLLPTQVAEWSSVRARAVELGERKPDTLTAANKDARLECCEQQEAAAAAAGRAAGKKQ